jgi:hypothetical protein
MSGKGVSSVFCSARDALIEMARCVLSLARVTTMNDMNESVTTGTITIGFVRQIEKLLSLLLPLLC